MNVDIDISNSILKSKRLILRSFSLKDLDDLFSLTSQKEIADKGGWKYHQDKEESIIMLDSFIKSKRKFAIEYEKHVIGYFSLKKYLEEDFPELKEYKLCELGFALIKKYWGQGIMLEAFLLVENYLINNYHLDALISGYFLENLQSKRLHEKMGFKFYKDILYKLETLNTCKMVRMCIKYLPK